MPLQPQRQSHDNHHFPAKTEKKVLLLADGTCTSPFLGEAGNGQHGLHLLTARPHHQISKILHISSLYKSHTLTATPDRTESILQLDIVNTVYICYALDRDANRVTHQEFHEIYNCLPTLQGAVIQNPDGGVVSVSVDVCTGGVCFCIRACALGGVLGEFHKI